MRPRDVTTFLALAFSLLFAVDQAAPYQNEPAQEAQASIEKEFKKEKIRGVNIEVRDGLVVLTGRPRNIFAKNRALEIALAHVKEVESEMEVATAESDKKLGSDVINQVLRYSRLEVFDDVNGFVKDGRIQLVGWVTEPYKKNDLEERMTDIIGIQEFRNDIEVLPNSQIDRELREVLARRIYTDSTFEDYASMTHPPIRIIVKNSRVILSGAVRGQLERTKALSLVRGTMGVLSVEDRLRAGN